ncbi:hypothetical protein C8R44DRAFT_957583, partial [Mycena epipterygia]
QQHFGRYLPAALNVFVVVIHSPFRCGIRNLARHFFFCGAVYAVFLPVTMNLTLNFFTRESGNLPAGTYIATGLSGISQLAEYLNDNPVTNITRLLISDSTVQDVENGHGYLPDGDGSGEIDYWGRVERPPLTDEEEDRREERRFSITKTMLRLKRAVRDIEEPLQRVLDKAAPTLEVLAYTIYIDKPSDCSQYSHYANGQQEDPRIVALVGRAYPFLTHLTFRNNDMHGASRVLAHPPMFPALTHLHVAHHMIHTLASLLDNFCTSHLCMTGAVSTYGLPAELRPVYLGFGWGDRVKLFLGFVGPYYRQRQPLAILTPGNLTVVVQPGFYPLLEGGKLSEEEDYRPGADWFCCGAQSPNLRIRHGEERGIGLFRSPCLAPMSDVSKFSTYGTRKSENFIEKIRYDLLRAQQM